MHKDVDLKIIGLLESDATLTSRELGERLNLPTTTVHNKIRRLEKLGVIRKYKAVVDKTKIGLPITALIYTNMSLASSPRDRLSQDELCEKIKRLDKVESVQSITGDFDMVIRLSVANTEELNDFVVNRLRKMEGLNRTVTTIILKEFD